MPISFKLDRALQERIQRLADARHQSAEAIVREAVEKHLQKEEESVRAENTGRHPSGQPWPRRNPVGGIITPV